MNRSSFMQTCDCSFAYPLKIVTRRKEVELVQSDVSPCLLFRNASVLKAFLQRNEREDS